MSKIRRDDPELEGITPASLSSLPPHSGAVRVGSGWVGLLLQAAALTASDVDLELALGALLDLFVDLEAGGHVQLRLSAAGGTDVLVQRGGSISGTKKASGAIPNPLKGPADGCAVELPGVAGGVLHFAAPAYIHATRETYQAMTEQAAQVMALMVRARQGEATPVDGQLAQLEKLAGIGQTAAEIVHELNNPLTAILAYSDYLSKRLGERGVADADVDRVLRIHEAASRIQHFCRDLTDYSRPAGSLLSLVDLQDVIDRALRFCMHGLRSANITVERVYRDVPQIRGVESALTQVFVNLISNAAHAMSSSGGTLSIRTALSNDIVVVEVADQGHGINEADRPKIFELYFTTKPEGTGVGLGLSIVQQIVRAHGGQIRAENREPCGTVFYIELPTDRPSQG